jgi:hypothetical protein
MKLIKNDMFDLNVIFYSTFWKEREVISMKNGRVVISLTVCITSHVCDCVGPHQCLEFTSVYVVVFLCVQ